MGLAIVGFSALAVLLLIAGIVDRNAPAAPRHPCVRVNRDGVSREPWFRARAQGQMAVDQLKLFRD
jgi:hypothetical protein